MTRTPSRRPIAVDLFSGVGGFSLGFERAGFDVVAAVELESVHAAVYQYNFPRTEVLNTSVARLRHDEVVLAVENGLRRHDRFQVTKNVEIDVLIGGPPCQGFSIIGQHAARESRNRLVFAFARAVEMFRPKYFVLENVPGMASKRPRTLTSLLRRLRSSGFKIVADGPQLLNAGNFGIPQDRHRLFIVGARGDQNLPELCSKSFQDPSILPVTVKDAIGDLPDIDLHPELWSSDCILLSDDEYAIQCELASHYAKILMGITKDPSDFSYPRSFDSKLLSSSQRTRHSAEVAERFAQTEQDKIDKKSRFHRLHPERRANTIRAGTGPDFGSHTSPRPIHPTAARVITAREAARLHSFPDWFRFHSTKWHAFRQIGNSVPPLLAASVASTIMHAIGKSPSTPMLDALKSEDFLLSLNERSARSRLSANTKRRGKL